MMAQAIALAKRPHILVGTPGRVVDHLSNTKVMGGRRGVGREREGREEERPRHSLWELSRQPMRGRPRSREGK
jgi:hypothetical protein